MKKLLLLPFTGLILLGVTSTASAESEIEDAIKYRQAGFAFMSWNMGKIKAQVVEGTVPFDADQVAAAADAVAAVANSGLGALFPPGSDQGSGFHETRLKSNFFEDMEEVARKVENFKSAANQLARVAAGGDRDAVKDAFGDVGKTCKACHDDYREKK